MATDTAKSRKKDPAKKPKNTPIKKILNQLALGATQAQVAKSVNVSKPAITQILKRYGIERNLLESFKENRADIFAGIQETVAASLTDADIKKASVRDRTILMGTLYDKERLERGLSTQNSAVILAGAVLAADAESAKHPIGCVCLKCKPRPVVDAEFSELRPQDIVGRP